MPRLNSRGERVGTYKDFMPLDTETLMEIAEMTGGEFYKAEDSNAIEEAFEKINETSKVEFEVKQFSTVTELFHYPLYAAAIFAMVGVFTGGSRIQEALA